MRVASVRGLIHRGRAPNRRRTTNGSATGEAHEPRGGFRAERELRGTVNLEGAMAKIGIALHHSVAQPNNREK